MAKQAKALGYTLVALPAQGEDRCPGPFRSRPSSSSVSHALRCPLSQGLRGRSVPSTPRQPTPPLNRGSPTAATPSTTFLTLSKTLLTLLQKGLTSRGSSVGVMSAALRLDHGQELEARQGCRSTVLGSV